MIEDITDPRVNLEPIESTYTGSSRYIMEVITSGLMIDHNYILFISVVENHFKIKVSESINFSTSSLHSNFRIASLIEDNNYYVHTHTHLCAHTHNTNIQLNYTATLFHPGPRATDISSGSYNSYNYLKIIEPYLAFHIIIR